MQLRYRPDRLPQSVAVRLMRAGLFAEADGAHLQQAGRERADRFRMRLGSAKNDDPVGVERHRVHVRDGADSDTPRLRVSMVA